jgi:hypothetical protein
MSRMIASVFAVALVVAGALFPFVAAAQGVALDISGWQRRTASTGTIYYQCTASTCAPNSTVSYRQQGPALLGPIAAFRSQHEALNRRMVEASNGRLVKVEMIEVSEDERDGAHVHTAVKVIESADGRREYLATSSISDGQRHFSIVSTAPTEAAARAHLKTFVPVVMLTGQLNTLQPSR